MIIQGHVLEVLGLIPDESVNCIVTSPPYWGLRDYKLPPVVWGGSKDCEHVLYGTQGKILRGTDAGERKEVFKDIHLPGGDFCSLCGAWRGQLGLEPTFQLYIEHLMMVFAEVKRVLRKDGTAFINLGDSYGGGGTGGHPDHKNTNAHGAKLVEAPAKSLCQIPSRFGIAMTDAGWILRNELIWYKRNCMPSSAKDRFTVDFEKVFMLVRNNKTILWRNRKTGGWVWKKPDMREWFIDSDGQRKRTWEGRTYWFEQQKEVATSDFGRGVIDAPQKYSDEIGNQSHSGWMGGDGETRNMRCVWDIPTSPFNGWAETSRLYLSEPDGLFGDNWHIVSPNCPEHGYLYHLLAIHSCDGHGADELIRNAHTGSHHAQELLNDSSPIERLRAWSLPLDNWDCSRLRYVLSAMLHNNENRRTGRAPGSNPSCIPCAGTLSHIERILKERGLSGHDLGNLVNNTLPDVMDARLLGKILCRRIDKSWYSSKPPLCVCPIYELKSEKSSHFAVFPEKLVEPMIKAGCPKDGWVLDPFAGAGTTGLVVKKQGKNFVGIELNQDYVAIAERRIEHG